MVTKFELFYSGPKIIDLAHLKDVHLTCFYLLFYLAVNKLIIDKMQTIFNSSIFWLHIIYIKESRLNYLNKWYQLFPLHVEENIME